MFSRSGLMCSSAGACLIAALFLSAPLFAQSSETNLNDRIVNVAEAQRYKAQRQRLRAWQVPLLPFRLFGQAAEKGLIAVDRRHLLDRSRYYLARHDHGFRPLFGGLGIGTGFTLGAEYYRNDFLRPGGQFSVPVRISSLLYQDYRVNVALPVDEEQRFFVDAGAAYSVRTQDDFFGLGPNSSTQDRTSYMLRTRDAFVGAHAEFGPHARAVLRTTYRHVNVSDGKDERFPVISDVFSAADVPGLAEGAREWIVGAEVEHDTRDMPGRPRHGGYHRVGVEWHQSADRNDFGFWRYEAEAERYVPLWSRNRILALRVLGSTNQARGNSTVPFFDQMILGGSQTMRGFREFRFRDLSGLLASAEYRYNLNSFMDVILLLDEGQVARQPGDFSWDGMRTSYGAGLRFLSATGTPFKIVFGGSNEGWRVYFSLGGAF